MIHELKISCVGSFSHPWPLLGRCQALRLWHPSARLAVAAATLLDWDDPREIGNVGMQLYALQILLMPYLGSCFLFGTHPKKVKKRMQDSKTLIHDCNSRWWASPKFGSLVKVPNNQAPRDLTCGTHLLVSFYSPRNKGCALLHLLCSLWFFSIFPRSWHGFSP